jgi:hypothetical protein
VEGSLHSEKRQCGGGDDEVAVSEDPVISQYDRHTRHSLAENRSHQQKSSKTKTTPITASLLLSLPACP